MNWWQGRNTLVTGGASFIGSHLTERLLSLGSTVRVADDLSSGSPANLSAVIDRIDFREGDLRDPNFATEACRDIDVVFHLAANHGGRGYIDTHPVECAGNLVLDGTVFSAAHKARVDRVCFASSACVYPTNLQERPRNGNSLLLREDWASPFREGCAFADGEYGWAKLMGEMALQAYAKQYGAKVTICRIFTAYGERENETHAVIAWVAKAFVGQDPFEIWGDGEQDRNFTYVGDIAQGLMLAAEKVADGTPVNLGTGEHIRVRDAVEMVFDAIGQRPKGIKLDTSKPTGVYSRAADLTRTRQLLGWEPQTGFAEGINRTVDWYLRTKDKSFVAQNLNRLLTER